MILAAAGGYWINDVHDFKIDKINKPERTVINAFLSVKKVVTVYTILNIIIFTAILFFSFNLALILLGTILSLFLYAIWLKRTSLAGNMLVAFLTALVLMTAGFIYEFTTPLVWAAIFAFEINLIREIIKDIEDIEGDLQFNLHTLPIQAGIQNTRRVVYFIYVLLFVSTCLPIFFQILDKQAISYYYIISVVLLVQIPSIFLIRHLSQCQITADYAKHSQYVKYLMLLGMITLLFL